MADGRRQQQTAPEISQGQLIDLLNQNLGRHLEAIMICVNYSKAVNGNADRNVATRLANQLHKEPSALNTADQIRSLGGVPEINPYAAQGSDSTEEMLRFKLEDKTETIRSYLARVRQCEALGEHAMAGQIREILLNEQQHQIYLATALRNHIVEITRSSILST